MADQSEIDALRLLINDPCKESFSDDDLERVLDAQGGDRNLAAAEVWGIWATRYSTLVNVSESGSSRSLGDLYKNAVAMRGMFLAANDAGSQVTAGRTRIGRIVRPT